MTGNDLVRGVDDGNERARYLLVCEAVGLEKAAMRSPRGARLHPIASMLHALALPLWAGIRCAAWSE
jgi:hypothetical protein